MMKEEISASLYLFVMLGSWQYDYNRCAPQYEHTNFVAMATHWVPDLPDIGVT